jgi:hypothetical protein
MTNRRARRCKEFAGLAANHDAIWPLQRHGNTHGAVEVGSLNCGTTLLKALKSFSRRVTIGILYSNGYDGNPWIKNAK